MPFIAQGRTNILYVLIVLIVVVVVGLLVFNSYGDLTEKNNKQDIKNAPDDQMKESLKNAEEKYIETTIDFGEPGEYKAFFENVLASGKDFDCEYTPASEYRDKILLKRSGNLLKQIILDSAAENLAIITDMNTKKTFSTVYETKRKETGCDWVVAIDINGESETWGLAVNYSSFMLTFQSEYEKGVLVCAKPSFSANEFNAVGNVCPVEQVFDASIKESDIDNYINNLLNE